jgi:hypothetical protein
MTRDEIQSLSLASLSPRVAEAVMGYTDVSFRVPAISLRSEGSWRGRAPGKKSSTLIPGFALKMDRAMRVVDHLSALGCRLYACDLRADSGVKGWTASFGKPPMASGMFFGDSLPEAICRAALMAVHLLKPIAPIPEPEGVPS